MKKINELTSKLMSWIKASTHPESQAFRETFIDSLNEIVDTLLARQSYNQGGIDIIHYATFFSKTGDFEPYILLKIGRALSEVKGSGQINEDTLVDLINYALFELTLRKLQGDHHD